MAGIESSAWRLARGILDTVRCPMLILDAGLTVVAASRSFRKAFPTVTGAVEGRCLFDLGGGCWDIPTLREILPDVLESSMPIETCEVEHDLPALGPRMLRLHAARIDRGPGGAPLLLLEMEDVTERKRAERKLRERAADLEAVMDAVPAAVWIAHDPECRHITGNRASCEMLRMPWGANQSKTAPDEERPTHFKVLKDGVEIPPDRLPVQLAASRGVTIRGFEETLAFEDGTCRHLLGNVTPLWTRDGRLRGAVSAFVDITERKQAEEAAHRAKEQADRANAAKTRFLAAASHDLRQPLQAATLFVGLLASRLRDPTLHDLVDKTQLALDSMGEMLSILLDVSRLDAGIVKPELRDFPIRPVLERLAAEVRPMLGDRGLGFRFMPSAATVRSDPQLLERILRNLLSNALHYTERGRILLGCRRAAGHLRLQVWDTGIGIPPDQLPAIFEEFYQVGNAARDRRKGLGLGLAVVRRLADLLEHPVAVRSIPGKGSMFEVSVPLATPGRRRADPAEAKPEATGTGLVAVIDDDRLLLGALRLYIEQFGYDVAAAIDVEDAFSLLRERHRSPDIILADFRLENGETGSHAINRLRQAFGASIPGILLTGDTSPDRLAEARNSGFALLHKPVKPDELMLALSRLLPDRKRQVAPATPARPSAAGAEFQMSEDR